MSKEDKIVTALLLILGAVGIFLISTSSKAETDVWLSASVASFHTDRTKQYNETNPGIGLEVTRGNHSAALGTYSNSYYRQSNYLTYSYRPLHMDAVSVGGFAGVASGYESPFIGGAVVSYEGRRFGANVLIVPPVGDRSGVFGLQLKWRL